MSLYAIIKELEREFRMASMNISLPDQMKEFIEKIATESGEYTNTSDYIRDLVRHDQVKREKIVGLQKLIDEGRNSGLSDKTMDEILIEARHRNGL